MKIYILYTVALLSCIALGFAIVYIIKNNRIGAETSARSRRLLKSLTHKSMRRKEEEENSRLKLGNQKNKNLLFKMDLALEKSGLRRKFPFLVTEVFILGNAAVAGIIFFVVEGYKKSIVYSLLAVIIYLFIIYTIIYLMVQRNEKLIEDNLLQFANLLESYSLTSDDLVSIFENVYEFLDEPLRSAILTCVSEMKTTGDHRGAFERLKLKFGNRSLNELLTNLEECSKNNANYGSVVRGIHTTLETHLTEKEERKKLANGARLNIIIMMGINFYCLNTVGDFLEGNILSLLQSSAMGMCVLIVQFCVNIFCLYKILTLGRK